MGCLALGVAPLENKAEAKAKDWTRGKSGLARNWQKH
jgi:hypothetical protein